MQNLLIVGCGDIGIKLAESLPETVSVYGLRRDIGALPAGIIGLQADVTQPDSLSALADIAFDAVVISLTPGESSDERYQQVYVQGTSNLLSALNAKSLQRLIFVSSTSVYGQSDDSWVDEHSPTQPSRYSGRRLLEAEQVCLAFGQQQGIASSIVRFAGIYGPGRLRLVRDVLAGKASPPRYSNRIHRDDCAGFLSHLLQLPLAQLQPCYVGVDDMPVRLTEVKAWLAKQLQREPLAAAQTATGGAKRCSNQRMKQSGYHLIYSNYQQGYAPILSQLNYTE
ncbi:NAD-dependent epimerase/dehydratase family protein [Dasania sp. GY-MA-18]|uniref:NAD-dependent epimerase/dehydratase family protein n=1 Tax=Dasania phycosphaerae TaxID=2950436 RepID=A0A9J6RNA9_9GAMM|nr:MULTISPECIES: NAD-dependent epimerase/dehydratase family protein [Dasania]MCR8923780.1 NAD-dependent epimerase/dehydratase family protein [Dasania sp. GY-MA-18]MCZ0866214.1 NAD-dependent epimerase/dehydratase family protein [Dasania phycosphaerae]MCZ0869938.1 NAD-dependent epimerase/dehydratase family protein [Dasania phycosphaerae]